MVGLRQRGEFRRERLGQGTAVALGTGHRDRFKRIGLIDEPQPDRLRGFREMPDQAIDGLLIGSKCQGRVRARQPQTVAPQEHGPRLRVM